ncbi:hypothetical protein FI667_g3988, partial [Globisporangium splendens]
MMSPLEDRDPSPTHVEPSSGQTISLEEREMVFYRRPDISIRQLFFQPRRGEEAPRKDPAAAPPVQLLGLDGQSHFGIPVAHTSTSRGGGANGGPGAQAGASSPTLATRNDNSARVNAILSVSSRYTFQKADLVFVGLDFASAIAACHDQSSLRCPEQHQDTSPSGTFKP